MNTLKDYDVLRLIEHNRICYVSSDVVGGYPLGKWLKYHPYLSKEQLIKWIHDIVRQLIQIHKCRGNPNYQYVNPYNIIVSEDKRVCFLDINAESNKEHVKMMQKGNVREYFLPKNYTYQDEEEKIDIYGLGKTIQFMIAFAEVEPNLTKREERKIQKMIARCTDLESTKRFREVGDVQTYLAECRIV